MATTSDDSWKASGIGLSVVTSISESPSVTTNVVVRPSRSIEPALDGAGKLNRSRGGRTFELELEL